MNNVELSEKIKGYLKSAASKAKKFEDTVAVTVSLISEENEDMYVAVREGKILVAPYRYDDNGCAIEAAPEIIDKIFAGELAFLDALDKGFVKVKSAMSQSSRRLKFLYPQRRLLQRLPLRRLKRSPLLRLKQSPLLRPKQSPLLRLK